MVGGAERVSVSVPFYPFMFRVYSLGFIVWFPVETHWVLSLAWPSSQSSVSCVSLTDFPILVIVPVNIGSHDLEDLFRNAVKIVGNLPVEIIIDRCFDCLCRVALWHQGEHDRRLPVGHVSGCLILLFLFHTIPHATANRRLVLDFVNRSANSGMAFLNAVLSKRLLVTAFHVIL